MRPILITGASGALGRVVVAACAARDLAAVAVTRAELDIADGEAVAATLARVQPWAVCNAAGFVRPAATAAEEDRCWRVNAIGPRVLAEACDAAGIKLMSFTSDLVFGGDKPTPYVEGDRPGPRDLVGHSQRDGDAAVLARSSRALLVRTSAPFGADGRDDFISLTLACLRRGQPVIVSDDALVTPTYLPDLVDTSLDLLIDDAAGVWHLVHPGPRSWADVARAAARTAGLPPEGVEGRPGAGLPGPAAVRHRPLGSVRGELLPSFDDALGRYQRRAERRP